MNKEFERYHTKIEIPVSVVLETIFSTDNQDVETLSRWALKYGFVDLVEKEENKYYKLQDDYTKQSFYTYLSKEEIKQYGYEDYLIKQNEEKDKEIERLNNIINELHSDLKTLWIVLWNMDTEMTGYQNEIFDKYYDEFYKGSDKE